MGRPSAARAFKVIRGDRADRVNWDEAVPSEQEIVCPDWVRPAGREVWDRLVADLVAKGGFTFWDAYEFAIGCDQYAAGVEYQADVRKRGAVVKGYRGQLVKNPSVTNAREAFDQAMRVFSRFGLTPSDRAQLKLGGERARSDADRYLS